MSPPGDIPAEPFSLLASGISQMMASVVSSSAAIDAALCRAERTTSSQVTGGASTNVEKDGECEPHEYGLGVLSKHVVHC
jgi:hypothetical protein